LNLVLFLSIFYTYLSDRTLVLITLLLVLYSLMS